jgi:polyhydroxyalkanoate synthesis regulator phasin
VPRLSRSDQSGASDALRTAIERTFEATASSAAETGVRARELLDEVVRRGEDARDDAARRIEDAREASARRIEAELRTLSERLEKLEAAVRGSGKANS